MSELLVLAGRLKKHYVGYFQKLCEQYDLSQLEVDILLFLRNNPECDTARDIVELRGFAKSNVSKAVEQLRAKGFLTVGVDGACRRIRHLRLASNRAEAVEALAERQRCAMNALFTGFSDSELAFLKSCLERMESNLAC